MDSLDVQVIVESEEGKMLLKDLVKKLSFLMDEFGNREVVASEVVVIDELTVRKDMPVFDIGISEEHQNEICLIVKYETDNLDGTGLIGFLDIDEGEINGSEPK